MTIHKAAERMLKIPRGATEADIRARICTLLEALGQNEYYLEYNVGGGKADIYLPRLRTIIETKSRGKVDHPYEAQSGEHSPFDQLNRYVKGEITSVRTSLFRDESSRQWYGILTDGRVWHRWSYVHRDNPAPQEEDKNFQPASANELVGWLQRTLIEGNDPIGKPWVPSNPVDLFRIMVTDLREIYDNLPDEIAHETETKQRLWGDMLRSSGMYPSTEPARNRLFVLHSFLVALARGVIWSMAEGKGESDPENLLGDGFISWIVQTTLGRNWARALIEKINDYDWRMRQGDVLRPLYEEFVDVSDRRDFGEIYTPDWLAELMVQETLDDDWCKNSIEAALSEIHNKTPLRGVGVLDPACGSGTFLYHFARRLLNHKAMFNLTEGTRSQVVARLVNGIDIHPVACEFSRATLLRALPSAPAGGAEEIRVYNGDSLQLQGEAEGSLFKPTNGEVQILSPGGSGTITLPGSFVERGDIAVLVRSFTETAVHQKDLPHHIRNSVNREDEKNLLAKAHEQLKKVIKREGNSVWAWYITNSVGPYMLTRKKVDRIVSNPPWVPLSRITVTERHRNLQGAAQKAGVWQGGRLATKFDIAQLFVKRCREKYLNNQSTDPASWIVKSSALKAKQWKNFRNLRKKENIHGQSIDLKDVQVFGGGDARRCCLLFDIKSTSLGKNPQLLGTCLQPRRKPGAYSTLDEALQRVVFQDTPAPIPKGKSYYHENFRQGATITPNVLTKIISFVPSQSGRVIATTLPSIQKPWIMVQEQEVEIPQDWLLPYIPSEDMLPFSLRPGGRQQAIIPVGEDGKLLDLVAATQNDDWSRLNEIYIENKGKGKTTPQTLINQLNYHSKLSHQLPLVREITEKDQLGVLYPASGDNMRGCRYQENTVVIDTKLYYAKLVKSEEAAYLVSLLNAPSLALAFRESRSSNRDFHKTPWECVPIPEFDPDNKLHLELAGLTVEAETATAIILQEIQNDKKRTKPLRNQDALSKRIRAGLVENGIAGRIDEATAKLLPDQVR